MKLGKIRLTAFVLVLAVIQTVMYVTASANIQPVFEMGRITAQADETVRVPLMLENNTEGICGATITINYDKMLTLTKVEKGEVLSTLTMTKPGDVTANPVNIVWDGMEADASNGVIAYLTFTAPSTSGTYPINISYEDGDILDGNISSISATMKSGSITVDGETAETKPTIKAETVSANPGEAVIVPLSLSSNIGICGATITINYDKMLTLTKVEKGEALSTLTMTKPGDVTANPVNIVWDGMEADASNGVIAYLTFTAPSTSGTYPINISYEDGNILDGDVSSIEVAMINGAVKVGASDDVTVTASGKSVTLTNDTGKTGEILIAYYQGDETLLYMEKYEPAALIEVKNISENVSKLKVMWWENINSAKPLCGSQEIKL